MTNPIDILSNLTPADLDAGEVFSGTHSGHRVKGFAAPSPFTPAVDMGCSRTRSQAGQDCGGDRGRIPRNTSPTSSAFSKHSCTSTSN